MIIEMSNYKQKDGAKTPSIPTHPSMLLIALQQKLLEIVPIIAPTGFILESNIRNIPIFQQIIELSASTIRNASITIRQIEKIHDILVKRKFFHESIGHSIMFGKRFQGTAAKESLVMLTELLVQGMSNFPPKPRKSTITHTKIVRRILRVHGYPHKTASYSSFFFFEKST